MAKEDALLAVIGYGMVRVNEELNPIIDNLYEKAFGTHFNENRKYVDEHYRTIPFPFDEIPNPSFQNHYHWSLDELEGYFNSWSAIQKMKSEGYNPVDKTISELKQRVNNTENIEAAFPVFMRLGRVRS